MKMNLPCWLSPLDKAIGEALINQADFIYCGREEDFIIYDVELGTGYKLKKVHGWQLSSAYGEVAIEAIKDGALFGKCLELLPNVEFEAEVRLVTTIIRTQIKRWQSAQPTQLRLF